MKKHPTARIVSQRRRVDDRAEAPSEAFCRTPAVTACFVSDFPPTQSKHRQKSENTAEVPLIFFPIMMLKASLTVHLRFHRPAAKWVHPQKRLILNMNNHQFTSTVDVLTNGQIHWVAGGNHHGWLSLSGIVFSLDSDAAIKK